MLFAVACLFVFCLLGNARGADDFVTRFINKEVDSIEDFSQAKDILKQLTEEAHGGICHAKSHRVGFAVGDLIISSGAPISGALDTVEDICAFECQGGCAHGAVGKVIEEIGVSRAGELCEKAERIGECVHATGHAFLRMSEHQPWMAEAFCTDAFARRETGLEYYCQAGVWMEFFTFHGNMHMPGPQKNPEGLRKQKNEKHDPKDPNLCAAAQTVNKSFCLYYQLKFKIYKDRDWDIDEEIAECAVRDMDSGSCIFGTVLAMTSRSYSARTKLPEKCMQLAEPGAYSESVFGPLPRACLDGLTARMLKYFPDMQEEVCGQFGDAPELEERCNERGVKVFYDLERDPWW